MIEVKVNLALVADLLCSQHSKNGWTVGDKGVASSQFLADTYEEPSQQYVILFATSDGLEMLNNTYRNRKLIAFIFD
jgi:hypothetical protein